MKKLFEEEHEEDLHEDFYNIENLEGYIEDDEINAIEEGFMIGYLG